MLGGMSVCVWGVLAFGVQKLEEGRGEEEDGHVTAIFATTLRWNGPYR